MPNISIDKYLHRFLRVLKDVNEQLSITNAAIILEGQNRVSELFPLKQDYPKKNFSDNMIGKIYEAYLKPFEYESWGDFSQKELAIKKVLEVQKTSFEDLLINMRVESLTAQYHAKTFEKITNINLELAEKFYKNSFTDESLFDYENSILKMEYAIRLFPENTIYFLRIAELFHRRGDIFQCIEYLEKITVNSYDITFPVIVRHNIALALRGRAYRETNPEIRGKLLWVAKNELEDIYQNQIGSNPTLNIINLKFKVGINYCHTLLDNHDFKSAGGVYGSLQRLSQSVVQIDDELRLRLDMILCILESGKNLEEGDKLFEKLYDSFTQNSSVSKNYEFLSEITSCWSAYYKNDTDRQIVILEKSFRDEIWGQRSDIEYKNMLQISDLYAGEKQYHNAIKYLENVLRYDYLDAELKKNIKNNIRFFNDMINESMKKVAIKPLGN